MGFGDIFKIGQFKEEIERLRQDNESLNKKLSDLGALDYYQIKKQTEWLERDYNEKKIQLQI